MRRAIHAQWLTKWRGQQPCRCDQGVSNPVKETLFAHREPLKGVRNVAKLLTEVFDIMTKEVNAIVLSERQQLVGRQSEAVAKAVVRVKNNKDLTHV